MEKLQNINQSNLVNYLCVATLEMLFGFVQIPDIEAMTTKLENAIKGGENAEADIAELAKVLNCPIETLKKSIESIKNETKNIILNLKNC